MEQKEIKIRLNGIELLSKSIDIRPENNFTGSAYNFDISSNIQVNENDKLVINIMTINTRELNKDKVLSSITIAVIFELANFTEIIQKSESGLYDIPANLDNLIKTVSISTSRGILFSEFRGTYLHNAILPIVFLQDQSNKAE